MKKDNIHRGLGWKVKMQYGNSEKPGRQKIGNWNEEKSSILMREAMMGNISKIIIK